MTDTEKLTCNGSPLTCPTCKSLMANLDRRIRDRDELFAKALIATLDPKDMERVLMWFNTNRPDQAKP
jgi:hypothetical protein